MHLMYEGTIMSREIVMEFKKFTGARIAEASGIAQVAPDRFIIVDDRKNKFYQATLHAEDQLTASALKLDDSISISLQDMEGVTKKPIDSWIYAITSYSGSNKKRRRRLVRFQIQTDDIISNMESVENSYGLMDQIQTCLRKRFEFLPSGCQFDIEAFSWAKDGQELLIGLRSPIIMGQAVIVRSQGIDNAFLGNKLNFSDKEISTLNLKGGGVRAMAYIPDLKGYLLVSGKGEEVVGDYSGDGEEGYFLWYWDGKHSVKEILRFPATTDTQGDEIQPEGLCAVTYRNGTDKSILFVSDDGDLDADTPGKYCLLSPEGYCILKKKCCSNN